MIDAGLRDRRITLLKRAITRSPSGAEVVTYSPHARLWACVRDRKITDRTTSGMADAVQWDMKATVLYTDAVTPQDRIEYRGTTYEIKGLMEHGRREDLEITLQRVS